MPVGARTAEELSTTLIRLMKVFTSLRAHAPRLHHAVDSTHYPVLFRLMQEPQRVSSLADCIHSDVSTVSRQVSHLVQHGLVEKIEDPRDGRAQVLSLTGEGRTLIEQVTRDRGSWFAVLLADWSDEDASTLLALMQRFADDVEAFKGRLSPGSTPPAPVGSDPTGSTDVAYTSGPTPHTAAPNTPHLISKEH